MVAAALGINFRNVALLWYVGGDMVDTGSLQYPGNTLYSCVLLDKLYTGLAEKESLNYICKILVRVIPF